MDEKPDEWNSSFDCATYFLLRLVFCFKDPTNFIVTLHIFLGYSFCDTGIDQYGRREEKYVQAFC